MNQPPSRFWPAQVPQQLALPDTNLFCNISVSAMRYPQHTAINYYGSRVSYQSLEQQAEALAGYLTSCGVAKGDRVLLFMQNCPQYIIGFYAILRANAVVVPVNPMNRSAELAWLIEDTGARVVLCASELLEYILPLQQPGQVEQIVLAHYRDYLDQPTDLCLPDELLGKPPARLPDNVIAWSDALSAGHTPPTLSTGPADLAVIPYSSGTTGNPKGCAHTHHSVMATAVYTAVWINARHDLVHLVSVPMFHVTGMQSCMNSTLYAGGTLVVMTRWDRRVAAELIQRCRVNTWRNISTMVIDLLSDPAIDSYDLRSLRNIGGGGAAMPAAIAGKLKEKTGLSYMEGYGLSETMAATHSNPPQACKPQCLGIPVIGVDSRVIDVETLQPLPTGQVGEIIMAGEQVFQGYWNNLEATAQVFIELDGKRFFRSGDLGYIDEDGYFFLVDRVKRMINASGYKVWPAEVESLMYAHPAIREVCVISMPHPRRGETVKAVVVAVEGQQPSSEEIIAWCHQQMAAYKCPVEIAFAASLPRSATGKVMWRQLQEDEWSKLKR